MAATAPITPPVEATLRILLNSVPTLMGAAVVRQPPGEDGVVASVGRMPWLHDRRLVTLQLPDDILPANRAVALDWPVPFQAEWTGAPPRLVISRLVFQGRTVGVLLGTLVTRDPITQQTREALDLSCEVIASAVASESVTVMAAPPGSPPPQPEPVAPPPPPPSPEAAVLDQVRRGVETADDARALGRVVRDALNLVTDASAFSVALFHLTRPEVAYRYKVVGPDRDSAELGRQHVEDGPRCAAATGDRRWHLFTRDIAIRDGADARTRGVTVLQVPMANGGEVVGVVSVQTFRPEGFDDRELRLISTIVDTCAPRFAQVRGAGRFQPASAPPPAPLEPATAGVLPPAAAVPTPAPPRRTPEAVLLDLLRRCAGAGFAVAFLVGVDPEGGVLRGELVSDAAAAQGLDTALGVTSGALRIPLDDRDNAIARAVRERRIVPASTLFEILRPAYAIDHAREIERAAPGPRTVTLPLAVNDQAAGALVLGPMAEDATFSAIEAVRGYVDDTARELAGLLA